MLGTVLLVVSSSPPARAADYTGDGIDDLAVGVVEYGFGRSDTRYVGGVHVIPGSSSGLTSAGNAFITQNTTGVVGTNQDYEYFGSGLGAGDINGDGRDELIAGALGGRVGALYCGVVWRIELEMDRSVLSVPTSQSISEAAIGMSGTCEDGDQFGRAVAVADFDGDGYDDVVVGIPGEDIPRRITDGGAVSYIRGDSIGMTTSGQLYYDQSVAGVAGTAEAGEAFGSQLAAGDFDGDGYADLAIGVPGDNWTGNNEGSVQVMYGTPTGPGVTSPDDELWSAGSAAGVAGTLYDRNECGKALAVGDFDGDGYDDLAIGCPGYDPSRPFGSAGAVLIVNGSAAGLDTSEIWMEGSSGVNGVADYDDQFGFALASGNFDGDDYDDLAIAAPYESQGGYTENGIVQVLMGSSTGITDAGQVELEQDGSSWGSPDDHQWWGLALASGDYNDDGLDDLAVGAPYDTESGAAPGGLVNVFYGSASGPSMTDVQLFDQDSPGMADTSEAMDEFGYTLR